MAMRNQNWNKFQFIITALYKKNSLNFNKFSLNLFITFYLLIKTRRAKENAQQTNLVHLQTRNAKQITVT